MITSGGGWTTSASDDFNRADGALAGSGPGWVTVSSNLPFNISGQKVVPSATTGALYVAGLAAPLDSQAEADVVRNGSSSAGVAVRIADVNNLYVARINGSGVLALFRIQAGVVTPLADNIVTGIGTATVARVGVRAVGDQISVLYGGAVRVTVTDATHTSGQAGLRFQSAASNPTADNFVVSVPVPEVHTTAGTATATASASASPTTTRTSAPAATASASAVGSSASVRVSANAATAAATAAGTAGTVRTASSAAAAVAEAAALTVTRHASHGQATAYAVAIGLTGRGPSFRDITLAIGPGRSRTLAITEGTSRTLTATGRSRTLSAQPRE